MAQFFRADLYLSADHLIEKSKAKRKEDITKEIGLYVIILITYIMTYNPIAKKALAF